MLNPLAEVVVRVLVAIMICRRKFVVDLQRGSDGDHGHQCEC
jgi:hypothetical protein